MAKEANKDDLRFHIELDMAERALLIRGLRTMWRLHVDSQIAVAAHLSGGGDRAQRESLDATDERLLEIRTLAGKLGAAVFGGTGPTACSQTHAPGLRRAYRVMRAPRRRGCPSTDSVQTI